MSFLNPFFIFGLLAASVPILLHLARREHARKIEFPTLMFLRRIRKKTIRYQKLRHLLLLLLRVLALILIVLAFMRPYREGKQATAAMLRSSSAHIILLDNSMSMQFQNRWERATKAATDILRKMDAGDMCAVLEFSDRVTARTQLSGDPSDALSQIKNGIEVSDRATRYGQALNAAAKLASDAGTGKRIIYLISDFQKNGYAAEEQDLHLPAGLDLRPVDVGSEDYSNLAIRDVRVLEAEAGSGAGALVKASVANFGNQDRKSVKGLLLADGRKIDEKATDIARGETRVLEFRLPGLVSGSHSIVVEIEDPFLTADNRFYLTLDAREKTPVLVAENPSEPGRRAPSFYLAGALNAGPLSPYRLSPVSPRDPEISGGLLIWNNVPGGNTAVQETLRRFVSQGGGLVIVLAEAGRPADFNRSFGSWLPVKMKEANAGPGAAPRRPSERYSLMTDIRMDHPVFVPFSKPHSGSFSSIRFFSHARVAVGSGAEILAAFDDGDPALVSVDYKKGRVLIFTSSADDTSNDLPLKAVYAPFWQQMLRYLENFRELRHWHDVGDIINARELLTETALRQSKLNPDANEAIVILDPQKNRVALSRNSDLAVMERAGFYEIRTMGLNAIVAANVQPRESDLTHGNAEEMVAGWISSKPAVFSQTDQKTSPEEHDRLHHYWTFLLCGALLFLASELFLSNYRLTADDLRSESHRAGSRPPPVVNHPL